jgi:hypothetical protein
MFLVLMEKGTLATSPTPLRNTIPDSRPPASVPLEMKNDGANPSASQKPHYHAPNAISDPSSTPAPSLSPPFAAPPCLSVNRQSTIANRQFPKSTRTVTALHDMKNSNRTHLSAILQIVSRVVRSPRLRHCRNPEPGPRNPTLIGRPNPFVFSKYQRQDRGPAEQAIC